MTLRSAGIEAAAEFLDNHASSIETDYGWLGTAKQVRNASNILRGVGQREMAAQSDTWQPIDTAPKDGTLVELVVDYAQGGAPLNDASVSATIGFNNLDNTGEDRWQFAGWSWSHDHFCEGSGEARWWRPSRLNECDAPIAPFSTKLPHEEPDNG